jgi:HEAT repeat protein
MGEGPPRLTAMRLEIILLVGVTTAALCWGVLSVYVLCVTRRRQQTRSMAATILATLQADSLRAAQTDQRLREAKPMLDRLSRDMILHMAADADTPSDVFDTLTAYMFGNSTADGLVDQASAHRGSRNRWRRTAALKVLSRLGHPQMMELLRNAVEGRDDDVVSVGFALLRTSSDPGAVDILIAAIRGRRHPAARVAVLLESSPQRPGLRYRELLSDADPLMRQWGATLLGDYPEYEWVERELVPLIEDSNADVRQAAITSLGRVGNMPAEVAALRLLDDSVPSVRAAAARALGQLERTDCAQAVAGLLGDATWAVRFAARQSLEQMGADVWPVLVRCLEHPDRFVRNGAAEVFQNIRMLDSFIVLEASSDDPSPAKIDLLRRIGAAGGTRLADSLIERAGPTTGPRIRRLLESTGLEHAGAA